MTDKLINPSGIPHFIGDLATLDIDVMLLTADAGQFRASGSNVHTTFQGLSAFYSAPEAEDLFATTLPVQKKSDAFSDDLEKVTSALSDYSAEVQPLVQKLDALKTDATTFVNSVSGDDDWRKDQDKVDHNNDLWHDVNHTVAAFEAAERTAYNKIMALISGTPLTTDDGSHGKNMYGYNADDLDHAPETPWGAPAEREYEGWRWLAHQGKQVWDGVWTDGVVATFKGVGTLFGADGWDAAGESWKNLAKIATAATVTQLTYGAWWLTPDDQLPSWLRESRTAYKQYVKGFVAWDEWKTNPARAGGTAGFNILTVLATDGAGSAASGAGKAGAAARALSTAGKVGRAIDPVTYMAKAGKLSFVKVGDTFSTLKNLHTGTTADLLKEAESLRSPEIPANAIPYVDEASGKVVYLTGEGHILNSDGSLRQHADEALHESSADDHARLDSSDAEHSSPQPEPAGAHPVNNSTADAAGQERSAPPEHRAVPEQRPAAADSTAHASHTDSHPGKSPAPQAGHGPPSGHADGADHRGSLSPGGPSRSSGGGEHGATGASGNDGAGPRGTNADWPKHVQRQVEQANQPDKKWLNAHYGSDGRRLREDGVDEFGDRLTKLKPDPDHPGQWLPKIEKQAQPPKYHLGETIDRRRADATPENLEPLDEHAHSRRTAIDTDQAFHPKVEAAEKAYAQDPTPENKEILRQIMTEHAPLHENMGKQSEAFGERVAELQAIPDNYDGAHWVDLADTPNHANRFDQVWRLDDGRLVVVEAKSNVNTSLGHRTLETGKKVSQGTRGYFEDILKKMEERGRSNPEEARAYSDLSEALDDGKVEYVLVKGRPDGHTYAGYIMKKFDISLPKGATGADAAAAP
ncbi:hypothetical protein [Streptomyces sp. NPDC047028]|uniref:hypothetical protein n=1 Tax=Streptomyces sp. NPDC047028 TaxID=3155793 RepID=UPI0033FD257A